MRIEIDFQELFGKWIAALHSWPALLITAGGFFATAIAFSGWDIFWKLFCWGLLFGIPGFIKLCASNGPRVE